MTDDESGELMEPMGNENEPKIVINDTISYFLNCNQHFNNFNT